MKSYYELRLRPLETTEFVEWFERWNGKEEEYSGVLQNEYLSERRFALIGWLAAKTPGVHKMTSAEFVTMAMPMSIAAAAELGVLDAQANT